MSTKVLFMESYLLLKAPALKLTPPPRTIQFSEVLVQTVVPDPVDSNPVLSLFSNGGWQVISNLNDILSGACASRLCAHCPCV